MDIRVKKGASFGKNGINAAKPKTSREQVNGRTDYRTYQFSKKEVFQLSALYVLLVGAVVFLFYMKPLLMLAGIPVYPYYMKLMRKSKSEARRKKMGLEFRTALNSLSVSLRAGRSVESAFRDAAAELAEIVGTESDLTREFVWMTNQIRVSVPVEQVLTDFSRRSGVEDIENFAVVFTAAKRMGGDIAGILRNAAESIEGKIEVEREIEMTLAAKRMEQKVMAVMPCGIILYMRLASPGFLDVMYETTIGMLVMTACLAAYAGAVYWSRKIADIQV